MAVRQFDGDDLGRPGRCRTGRGPRISTAIGVVPLPHADQDGPVADDVHVAAFDAGRLVVDVVAAVVGDEVGAGEQGMEAVDGPGVERSRVGGRAWPWG